VVENQVVENLKEEKKRQIDIGKNKREPRILKSYV
jgi:hypothetical protein